MKKLIIYLCLGLTLFGAGCTRDFDEINTDPTRSTPENFNPNYFLSSSQWEYINAISGYNGAILFQSGWMQIFASTSSGAANYYSNADKYVPSGNTNDYLGRSWNIGFRSSSLANEIITLTSDDPELVNLTNIAVIMKVLNAQYLADMYGDIPYTQALQAKSGLTLPVYDPQENVYKAMLSDLDAALSKLDPNKQGPTADLFPYKGDVTQWKRFGYSLMLRIAMRLVKADPNTAKTYAEKAAAGGTFASVADDAYVKADDPGGYRNPNAAALNVVGDLYEVRWSKRLIDFLKSTNDPRLGVIAEVPPAGLAANQDINLPGNNDPAIQIGMPNGYDLNGGATDISKSPGYPGGTGSGADFTPIGKYSRPRNDVYGDYSGVIFVLTYAETELLLAEAAVRGWNVGGTAAQHFANGVSGGIQSLAAFGPAGVISIATANAYAAAHPLDVSSTQSALKMINELYWVTTGTLLNFVEAWNNWKRSGYPELANVNYPGSFSGGVIPRRQPYPLTESTLNSTNYQEAVSRLTGGDTWTSRVWWDK